jgi:hypothetical protein
MADVVARVLAPGGRAVVGFSVMRGRGADLAAAVAELADRRGPEIAAVRTGATPPIPWAALVLRAAPLTRTG